MGTDDFDLSHCRYAAALSMNGEGNGCPKGIRFLPNRENAP
jgi:hypothetical protein